MKLTELILELHTLMLKEGNLDVYARYGCGCCDYVDEPTVRNVLEDGRYRDDPVGVYLN